MIRIPTFEPYADYTLYMEIASYLHSYVGDAFVPVGDDAFYVQWSLSPGDGYIEVEVNKDSKMEVFLALKYGAK